MHGVAVAHEAELPDMDVVTDAVNVEFEGQG